METLIYEGTVTALSSITHNGGQSFGIESKLRREKFVQPDGTVEEIPLLSGNGLRGKLRDLGMWQMCKTLGFGVNEETGEVNGLSLSAFYFLFSGGSLGEGKSGIDIDYARNLRLTIPLSSVFGGAVGNQIMPGKLKVGKAIPICAETAHLLPARFAEKADVSIWDYLQTEMYTRKDDDKNEKLRSVVIENQMRQLALTGSVEILPETVLAVKQKKGDTAPQQMMYHTETFAAGTRFYWKLTLEDLTDLEYDAFMTTLAEFSKSPYVGGKSAVGLGEVSVNFDNWFAIDSRLENYGEKITRPVGQTYSEHLQNNVAKIKKILETI